MASRLRAPISAKAWIRTANHPLFVPARYFSLWEVPPVRFMGNACRVDNDRRTADDLFSLARQVIAEHGVTDPEVVARVDDLLGSLRKDQRRFAEAARLLKRARKISRRRVIGPPRE